MKQSHDQHGSSSAGKKSAPIQQPGSSSESSKSSKSSDAASSIKPEAEPSKSPMHAAPPGAKPAAAVKEPSAPSPAKDSGNVSKDPIEDGSPVVQQEPKKT